MNRTTPREDGVYNDHSDVTDRLFAMLATASTLPVRLVLPAGRGDAGTVPQGTGLRVHPGVRGEAFGCLPQVSDFDCLQQHLSTEHLAQAEVAALTGAPLSVLPLAHLASMQPEPEIIDSALPFDISGLSAAQAPVARKMLARLTGDMTRYAETLAATKTAQLLCFVPEIERLMKALAGAGEWLALDEVLAGLSCLQRALFMVREVHTTTPAVDPAVAPALA